MSIELNRKIKINTYKNAIFQTITIAVGFYMFPLLTRFLDDKALGVWFTMMSIASWFMILDIGIAQGLRNKLTNLIAKNKIMLARAYLSSTYFYFAIFIFLISILMSIILYFSDLNYIFNVTNLEVPHLYISVLLVFFAVLINLFFTINFSLSNALQNSSFMRFRNMIFNTNMLISLVIMMYMYKGDLLDISIIFMASNILVNIFTTLYLYKYNFHFLPSYKLISFKLFKGTLKVGLDFLIINISTIIIFSTDTILITHLLGTEQVVYYTVTLKFFTAFVMIQGLYISPLWSAYTAKYLIKDIKWIKSTLKKSLLVTLGLIVGSVLSIKFFQYILALWMGSTKYYNIDLVIAITAYISVRLWNSNFSTLLNGLGLTKIQVKTGAVATILNIPLSIYFVDNMGLGISGIAYGSMISIGIFAILAPIYSYRILKKK